MDVAPLVLLAAPNQRARAEQLHDGLAQRLAPVDDPQPHAIGIEPALEQAGQQRGDHARGLGGALAQAQHVLVALGVDAQGHEDDALAEVDAVDHHHRQFHAVQAAAEPWVELFLAKLHEAPRHGALGGHQGAVSRRHRVLGGRVAARGHARGDSCQRRRIQRVGHGGPLEGGQREFALVERTRAQASHRDALATEHDAAGGAATAHSTPAFVGHVLGAARRDAIGLHHRGQHALAGIDAQA
jgi:hypothetical protein